MSKKNPSKEDFAKALKETTSDDFFQNTTIDDLEKYIDDDRKSRTSLYSLRNYFGCSEKEVANAIGVSEKVYKRAEDIRFPSELSAKAYQKLSDFYTKVIDTHGGKIVVPPSLFHRDRNTPAPAALLTVLSVFIKRADEGSNEFLHALDFYKNQLEVGYKLVGSKNPDHSFLNDACLSYLRLKGKKTNSNFNGQATHSIDLVYKGNGLHQAIETHVKSLEELGKEAADVIKGFKRNETRAFSACLKVFDKIVGNSAKYKTLNEIIADTDKVLKDIKKGFDEAKGDDKKAYFSGGFADIPLLGYKKYLSQKIADVTGKEPLDGNSKEIEEILSVLGNYYGVMAENNLYTRHKAYVDACLSEYNDFMDGQRLDNRVGFIQNFLFIGAEREYMRVQSMHKKHFPSKFDAFNNGISNGSGYLGPEYQITFRSGDDNKPS